MEKKGNLAHGIKWGIIIGIIYCIMVFLRYNQGVKNPLLFGMFTFVGYIVVLILLFICGVNRKKALGGYIELKDAFQTMFVAVICFEIFYTVFNFVYLRYINPDFFHEFKQSMEVFLQKSHTDQAKIDDALKKLDEQTSTNVNLGSSFLSFAYGLVLSGMCALVFALIIKKKKENFQIQKDQFFQS